MKVGILGTGQLARMMALSGIPLGLEFNFFGSDISKTVNALGQCYQGLFDDTDLLDAFISDSDVITYENENIPTQVISYIQEKKRTVHPNSKALAVTQDRLLEREFLTELNIPVSPYIAIESKKQLLAQQNSLLFPIVIKKRRHGYDGKGQVMVETPEALSPLSDIDCEHCIVEQKIAFSREVSLIGCRSTSGQMRFYDICENHHQEGILYRTENKANDLCLSNAKQYLTNIMTALNYVGVCTAEFFDVAGQLVVNELAPRVHNTGHWTIEGAVTSQFENHLRCILDWPLGNTSSQGHYLMQNLLGEIPNVSSILEQPGIHLHDYQKTARAKRKVGHLTMNKEYELSS